MFQQTHYFFAFRGFLLLPPLRIDAFILEWGIEKVIGGILSKSHNDFDTPETIFDTTVTGSYIPSRVDINSTLIWD